MTALPQRKRKRHSPGRQSASTSTFAHVLDNLSSIPSHPSFDRELRLAERIHEWMIVLESKTPNFVFLRRLQDLNPNGKGWIHSTTSNYTLGWHNPKVTIGPSKTLDAKSDKPLSGAIAQHDISASEAKRGLALYSGWVLSTNEFEKIPFATNTAIQLVPIYSIT
jgi:hypothetical protein